MNCLAPFNPTTSDAIEIGISVLDPQADDIIYDIGCGDGRYLIQACKKGGITCQGIGIEWDSKLSSRASEAVKQANMEKQICILCDDALNHSFSNATAIILYIVPNGMKLLKPQLHALYHKGVRLISNMFSIPDLEPTQSFISSRYRVHFYHKQMDTLSGT